MPVDVEEVLRSYVRGNYPQRAYEPSAVLTYRGPLATLNPPEEDFEVFISEMKTFVNSLTNPLVADVVARGAPAVWDAVRLVNYNTKQGFKGSTARADALLFNPLTPRDTGSGGGFPGTNPLTTWYVNVTSVGPRRWIPTSGTIDMLINSLPVLSHVYLGFTTLSSNETVGSVQLIYDDPWAEEVLNFSWSGPYTASEHPVHELKQPWLIRPGASYRINVRDIRTGDSILVPIGFSIKRGGDVGASAAIAA